MTSAYWNVDKDTHILTASHAKKPQYKPKSKLKEHNPLDYRGSSGFNFNKMDKVLSPQDYNEKDLKHEKRISEVYDSQDKEVCIWLRFVSVMSQKYCIFQFEDF